MNGITEVQREFIDNCIASVMLINLKEDMFMKEETYREVVQLARKFNLSTTLELLSISAMIYDTNINVGETH